MTTTLKMDGLHNLIKALQAKEITARVGILNNPKEAMIGAVQEFGGRSFLKMPISLFMQAELDKAKTFTAESLKKVVSTKSLMPWAENMAQVALLTVLDSFEAGGYGQWKPDAPETMAHKKDKRVLIETGTLRNSITYEVGE